MNKKNLFTANAVIGLLGLMGFISSNNAFAFVQPFVQQGWDRPIYQADMSVLNQQGKVPAKIANAKSVELVMTQQDGTPTVSGFVMLIDGQSDQNYNVKSISHDRCGSTVYQLLPVQNSGNLVLNQVFQNVQVTDHSDSVCMEFHKYRWEMKIDDLDLTHQAIGQIQLVGNPESVITPQ